MADSPILDITYLEDEQHYAEVKVNEAINRIESCCILSVVDRDDTGPPTTPLNGDVYIPAATATGDWTGHEDELAIYYDGWTFLDPYSGMMAYIEDEDLWLVYDGTSWHRVSLHGEYFDSLNILDRDLSAPPGSPSEGDTYIIDTSPTGAWSGHAGDITVYTEGGWVFRSPRGGMVAFVKDEKIWIGYSSEESLWHILQRNYSTTEEWTGEYYGSAKIYEKRWDIGTLPNSTTSTDAHGIVSLLKILDVVAVADDGTDQINFSSGWSDYDPTSPQNIKLHIDNTNIEIDTNFDASGYSGEVIMRYTRS